MAEFNARFLMVDAYERNVGHGASIEALDHAAALVVAGNYASDLANTCMARILWYTVTERTTYTDTVDATANRDETLIVTLRKADNEKAPWRIPTPVKAMLNADGTLDLADTSFVALVGHLLAGDVRISDHEVVTEVISGRLDD